MRMARCLAALVLLLSMATPAMAQDTKPIENEEFNVTITPPSGWESAQGGDRAVASFKHRGSQSQIEVVGTQLMTPDVAPVFFKTFHKTLTESNFTQTNQTEATIGSQDGTQTSYRFEHTGVKLEVVIFQFTQGNNAWLVVGYMQEADKNEYMDDFKSIVSNMKFAEAGAEDTK